MIIPESTLPDTSSLPRISIVVPVYRNAATLTELTDRVEQVCLSLKYAFEIIFVNDACPENSLAVLKDLASVRSYVTWISLDQNQGQHRAVLIGLQHARGDWSAIMDADLQDPPESLPRLIQAANQDVDAVFGGRRGDYESSGRLFTSKLFKLSLHYLCSVPKDAGIFVLLSRRMVGRLIQMYTPFPSVAAMIGCTGFPMVSIPVVRAKRASGESAYNGLARIKSALKGIFCVLYCKWWPRSLTGKNVTHHSCQSVQMQEKIITSK